MKRKVQFAVILTEEGKTVLIVDNDGIYCSVAQWQRRFNSTKSKILYCSETDSVDITLSHYFLS